MILDLLCYAVIAAALAWVLYVLVDIFTRIKHNVKGGYYRVWYVPHNSTGEAIALVRAKSFYEAKKTVTDRFANCKVVAILTHKK